MTETNGFARRLAPRHAHHAPPETLAEAPQLYYAPRPTGDVLVATPPSSRGKKRARAVAATPATPTSGERKRMSGAQLRVFFLLCVGAYFSIIYFADEIVSFAEWISDEPPGHAWSAAVAAVTRPPLSTPPAASLVHRRPLTTRKEEEQARDVATQAPSTLTRSEGLKIGDEKNADGADAVETSETTLRTVDEPTERGNLRGADTKTGEENTDIQNPSPTAPARADGVAPTFAAEPITESHPEVAPKSEDAVKGVPSGTAEIESVEEALVETKVEKVDTAQDDAPLESNEEEEQPSRTESEEAKTEEAITSQLPASAEAPSLAVLPQPSREVAKAQDGAVNPDDVVAV